MFVEIPKRHFEKLKGFLKEQNLSYELSDCTLPGDRETFVHLELSNYGRGLNSYQIEEINSRLDAYFLEDKKERRGMEVSPTPEANIQNQEIVEKEQ